MKLVPSLRKKLPLLWFSLLSVTLITCGKSAKVNEREVVVEKDLSDRTSQHPSLTPALMREAQKAFKTAFENAVRDQTETDYKRPVEICNQAYSSLCFSFAFRDLMVNNLRIPEAKKPSIYSLLALNIHDSSKILIHPNLSYFYDDYDIFKMARTGMRMRTEASEPFEKELFEKYEDLVAGKSYNGKNITIDASSARLVDADTDDEKFKALLVNYPENKTQRAPEFVQIPKFKITEVTVNTSNLIEQMKILAERLARGKAQLMSVCGAFIRGFSADLLDKSDSRALNRNEFNVSTEDCGKHAVLVTHARIDEQGRAYISFKNSWGTDYSKTSFHELSVQQFLSILSLRLGSDRDARLSSDRMEIDAVAENEEPVHEVMVTADFKVIGKIADANTFKDDIRIINILNKEEILCSMHEGKTKNCKGTSSFKSSKDATKHYTYTGDFVIPDISPLGFDEYFYEGKGSVYLWDNIISTGIYERDVLRKGTYTTYFSADRGSQVYKTEEGDFDEDENLIKGYRKSYDRAGNVVNTEKVGL